MALKLRPTLAKDKKTLFSTEWCRDVAIEPATGARLYYATPLHAWERGTNENTNG